MPRSAIDPAQVEYWATLTRRHAAAGHGERARLIKEAQEHNGLKSADAVYRRMREFGGYQVGVRNRRRDAGVSAVSDALIELVAGMVREGARADQRQIMSVAQACSILAASGHQIPVSASQMARLLRRRRLSVAAQAQAEHFGELRSLHPNHVHQIDPSLCLLYYERGGKQRIAGEEYWYKNKPDAVHPNTRVWRYVRTDHASGEIDLRYYLTPGETQQVLFDFLLWTWGRQAQRVSHGVPKILMWDSGSANTSHGIKHLLDALEVRHIAHIPGRPNVKGQVEKANHIIETSFESRLRFEPVHGVEALNAAAADWAKAFNAGLIPKLDTRVTRPGAKLVRTDLWMLIRPEQIREMPSREVCERLFEGRVKTCTVRSQALIQYSHPALGRSVRYSVRQIPELHRGDVVEVAPLLIGEDGAAGLIRLRWRGPDGQVRTWRLAPEMDFDAFGRPLSAAVIGESYQPPMKREAERRAEALDALAYPAPAVASPQSPPAPFPRDREGGEETRLPAAAESASERARKARAKHVVPFEGRLNAVSHLSQIEHPSYLPRRGAEVAVVAPEDLIPPVPLVRALARLRVAWGRPIAREESQWLAARYGQAIPEGELERLVAAGGASGERRVASRE